MLEGKMGLKACGLTSTFISCINLIKLVWIFCRRQTPRKPWALYAEVGKGCQSASRLHIPVLVFIFEM